MTKTESFGFEVSASPIPGHAHVIRVQRWSKELEAALQASGASSIVIDSAWHDDGRGLDFLAQFAGQIRRVSVAKKDLRDLSALLKLKRLEELTLECPVESVDFAGLPQLRRCLLGYPASLGNVGACTSLDSLALFNIPVRDLSQISGLRRLRSLHLTELRRLDSLSGIEQMQLASVRLRFLPKLRSVSPLAALQTLKEAEIVHGRRIDDLPCLRDSRSIERLRIDGASLPSFEFVTGLVRLREFGLWNTRVHAVPCSVAPFALPPELRSLKLTSGMSRVTDIERLGEARKLEVLMLSRGPKIKSLEFLRSLVNLRELAIVRTPVVDGNLNVLLDLPRLERVHSLSPWRKNYSHSASEIDAILARRHGRGDRDRGEDAARMAWARLDAMVQQSQLGPLEDE